MRFSLQKSGERDKKEQRLENSQDTRDGAMDDGLTKTKNMMVRAMLPSSYFFGFFIQFVECFGQVTMILKYLSGSLELQNAMQKYLINISINIQFQFLFCNVVSSIAVYELLHRQTTQIG